LAIKDIVVPDTKRQLRGILGLFSYFRKYVPALAAKTKILTDLTSKRAPQNVKLQWTEKYTEALETFKQELREPCQNPLYNVSHAYTSLCNGKVAMPDSISSVLDS